MSAGRGAASTIPTRLGRACFPWFPTCCEDGRTAQRESTSSWRCEHLLRRIVFQQHLTIIDLLAHKVVEDVDLLGAFVELGVIGQRGRPLAVFRHLQGFIACIFSEFSHEPLAPHHLSYCFPIAPSILLWLMIEPLCAVSFFYSWCNYCWEQTRSLLCFFVFRCR